jgi:protein involved in polysaccharide export with SLBB domain
MRGFSSILAVASLLVGVQSDEYNHKYNPGDAVQFYVHKVGNAVDPEIHIQDE